MLNDEVKRRNNEEVEEDTLENKKSLINVTTHISDEYVKEDDLKIEIHKLINTITDKKSFDSVKVELEDRFGKLNEDIIIYMYSEWFDKMAEAMHVSSLKLLFQKKLLKKWIQKKYLWMLFMLRQCLDL